ncbi:DUF3311 domain-containing protein [Alkalihalophilus lindianensis]|jgi:hypothetical protein|uniref:DUF3311 domain-containing protein n=1 Tax=Alkalihalophilus lindianensis TaxID=1630542 RepID=A0ABU3XD00_9BACI|nr:MULTISPECIES: DUF3311 domain-containing protein [Bacillaceae]KMJ55466.1 hypothetical protein AB685_27100 [Bacillus sp. LL01]MDV2685767.1 DUF3311 domain-containing protein [Alkalihalophilus lindianensis]
MFQRYPTKKKVLYSLIILSFIVMETPLILLANTTEPFVLGMPFFLFWNLLWWFVLTALFLIGYLINWGSKESSETVTDES